MGDEVLSPPFLSSMAQRSLSCASCHINVLRPKIISKKIYVSRKFESPKCFKLSKFTPSIWRRYNDDFSRSDLIGQEISEWLTWLTVNFSRDYTRSTNREFLNRMIFWNQLYHTNCRGKVKSGDVFRWVGYLRFRRCVGYLCCRGGK